MDTLTTHQTITDRPNSTLRWDGSDLGNYEDSIVESCLDDKELDMVIVTLKLSDNRIIACLKKYRNSTPLITDELKPLLGLSKSGMHTISICGYDDLSLGVWMSSETHRKWKHRRIRKYLLIRLPLTDEDQIIPYKTLLKYEIYFLELNNDLQRTVFDRKMAEIVLFYQICRVRYLRSNIQIRESKYGPYPHSLMEDTINEERQRGALTNVNLERWFYNETNGVDLAAMLLRMTKSQLCDVDRFISRFREEFEKLVNRLDPNEILTYWFIVDNVNNILACLDNTDNLERPSSTGGLT